MSLYDRLPRGVRRLFRLPQSRERIMRELDDEIRFHVENRAAALRRQGLPEHEALAESLAQFGDTDDLRAYCGALATRRDRSRRIRGWFAEAMQDLSFGARQLARAPIFALTVAIMLALGIGANTAIFSIVHNLMIAPLPFRDGNRMVMLSSSSDRGMMLVSPSPELVKAWPQRARSLEQFVLFDDLRFAVGDTTRGPVDQLAGLAIPPAAMSYVGVSPILGRGILPSDTMYAALPVALLGEGVWRRLFGADPSVVGKSILLNGTSHSVIGVMPDRFYLPFASGRQIFVAKRNGAPRSLPNAIAKLRPGVTIDAANREMARLFPPKSESNSYDDPPRVVRELDKVGSGKKQMILVLFGAVSFVLLIACANVANLLLARSWARQREFAIRAALGAGRARIVRQMFAESMVLAALGGVLGVATSFFVLRGIRAALPPGSTEFGEASIEPAVLWWSVGLSVFTGLLFGIAPALSATGRRVGESLKAGARSVAGGTTARRFRSGLVIMEVALSVVLLTGAGLLVRTLVALNRVEVGFDTRGVASVSMGLSGARSTARGLTDPVALHAAMTSIVENVRHIPGVQSAMFVSVAPPSFGIGMGGLSIDGVPATTMDSLKFYGINGVPPEYFEALGLPIKQGRTFTPSALVTDRMDGDEVIINESFAKRFWPGGNALGGRLRRGSGDGPWKTVVGIVADVNLRGLDGAFNKNLQMYIRAATAQRRADLVLRSDVPPAILSAAITKAAHDVDPSIRVNALETVNDAISGSMSEQRFILKLLGAFAVLALILAAVGLHGVIAYSVSQRTREIGVRVALGAQGQDVVRLVLAQGLAMAAAGVVLGSFAAVASTRALRSLLYSVRPGDPLTLAAVGAALLAIAILASYGPARRAAHLDPLEALRAD